MTIPSQLPVGVGVVVGFGVGLGDFVDRRIGRPRRLDDFGDSTLRLRSLRPRPRARSHANDARARRAGAACTAAPRPVASSRRWRASSSSSVEPLEHDRDVRGALADAEVTAAGAGLAVLARRALVGPRERDEQLVGRDLVVVLGVRDRRAEQLQARRRPRPSRTAASMRSASPTGSPRTSSSTWRTLYAEVWR